jgi:putative ABC transport system permease protein
MRTLVRKPLRDLGALGARGWALVAMIALGIGVTAGAPMSRTALRETRDSLYRDLALSDLVVDVAPVTAEELPPLGGIEGVAATARRYVDGSFVELADGTSAAALLVHLERPAGGGVDELRVLEGRLFRADETDAVVVDHNFARRWGLHPGDTLFLEGIGTPYPVRVVGVAVSPEFLIATVNPNLMVPAKGSLAVLFAPLGAVSAVFGYPLYNSLAFRYRPGADPAAVEASVLGRLGGLDVLRVTPRAEAFAYRFLEEGIKAYDIFIPAAVALLMGVAFLGTLLALDRLMRGQERELAALSALGARAREIAASVLLLAGALAVAAIVPGILLTWVVRDAAARSYATTIGLPEVVGVFSLPMVAGAVAIALAVALAAALRPAVQAALRPPQRGIRAAGAPGPAVLRRAEAALGRVVTGVAGRAALRGLFRRPGSTLATVVAIACAAGSAVAFRGSLASFERVVAGLVARERWDAAVDFRVPLDAEETARIVRTPGIVRAEPYLRGFAAADLPGGAQDFAVVGLPPDLSLRRLRLAAGRGFAGPQAREVILNRGFGAARDLRLGDHVRLRAGARRLDLVVVGLLSDASIGELYVPLAVARAFLAAPGGASGLFTTLDRPLDDVRRALHRTGNVARVFGKADVVAGADEYVKLARAEAEVTTGLQLAIAVLLVFTSLQLHVEERERDFAILRILGHRGRTIVAIGLLEVLAVGVLGLAASIPLGRWLAGVLARAMSTAWFEMPLVLHAGDWAKVFVPALLLLPLAAAPGLRRILTRNLAGVAGERELG